jgi:hypothetical protein
MIKTEDGLTTIHCDKCFKSSSAPQDSYNDKFWDEGWALNRGRKYEHLCFDCLPPKSKKAQAFVKANFK